MKPPSCQRGKSCDSSAVDRRKFLATSTATTVATVLLSDVFPGSHATAQSQPVTLSTFPRKKIASLASLGKLAANETVDFSYPDESPHTNCLLFKLGTQAGGGVGSDQDIVAFSGTCTHMGGSLDGGYVATHHVIGCGEHLTTFDLTRHGLVVAGHATTPLPQIVLEIESDDIYATGIIGLLYGYATNPADGA